MMKDDVSYRLIDKYRCIFFPSSGDLRNCYYSQKWFLTNLLHLSAKQQAAL